MITKIEIKNIKSIDNVSIDFQKAKYQYLTEMIFNEKNVNPIAVYGKNGSGKSSLLVAICSVANLLTAEKEQLNPLVPNNIILYNDYIKNNKKEFISSSEQTKSCIKIKFLLGEFDYEYFIETSFECITKEYLKMSNRLIFSRSKTLLKYNHNEIQIEKTFYSSLRKLANEIDVNNHIESAFNFLSNISFVDPVNKLYMCKGYLNKNAYDVLVDKSSEVKEILKKYSDFPLYNIVSQVDPILGQKQYFYSYEFNSKIFLPISSLSNGMFKNSLLLSTVLSMPKNGVLIVDELENALHPVAILDFLNIIKEKNIQLIFSSHNTFILQHLRPDQIFFAYWKHGFSKYSKLSDIYPNIRQVNNIEKMYLSNLFDEEIEK